MENNYPVLPKVFNTDIQPAYTFAPAINLCLETQNFIQGGSIDSDPNKLLSWFNMAIDYMNVEGYAFPYAPLYPTVNSAANQIPQINILKPYKAIPQQLLKPYIVYFIIYQLNITAGWTPPQLRDSFVKMEKFRLKILNSAWVMRNYVKDSSVAYDRTLIKKNWQGRY